MTMKPSDELTAYFGTLQPNAGGLSIPPMSLGLLAEYRTLRSQGADLGLSEFAREGLDLYFIAAVSGLLDNEPAAFPFILRALLPSG